MKRTMKRLLILLAAGLLAASCVININGGALVGVCTEEGIDYTEVRDIQVFRSISSSLPCNIYYIQADKQEVRVETTNEFAEKVLTTVEDGTLKLKLEEGRYPKLILRVIISTPDIEGISISGSGNILQEGALKASKGLNLKVSGSGDIQVGNIDCKDFSARVSGSGDIHLASVACDGFEATTSGSGHIDLETLTAKDDASVRISGSGRIRLHEVTVDGDMELRTSGSGSILVNGRCHDVDATTSSSGSISGSLSHTGIHTTTSGSGRVDL
jgi:hypothetical protein